MARAGLGDAWTCMFANDFDFKKGETYFRNWPDGALRVADVKTLTVADIPGRADLVWASFPCQDLSLAGGGAGLRGERSGTFWPFWALMSSLIAAGRAPAILTLENVCGTLTSHGGKDFRAIGAALSKGGYRCGAVVIDAALFLPQSRPRLFIVAVRSDLALPDAIVSDGPDPRWSTQALVRAYEGLPAKERKGWVWWNLPDPVKRTKVLADIIEDEPIDIEWHTPKETRALLAKMDPVNKQKVEAAKHLKMRLVGTVYKRTRVDLAGEKIQRAEVRFDGVAGCLRTPAGGSSRQIILVVEGRRISSRLISARETARLMGLDEIYRLPKNYNEAYHLTGDGVVVPVVRHLAANVLEPIVEFNRRASRAAAA